jgi:hypothetical protein
MYRAMSFCSFDGFPAAATCLSRRLVRLRQASGQHEQRDLPLGPPLVGGAVGIGRHGSLPPERLLGAGDLARGVVAPGPAVLQLDVRVGDDVVVPDRVVA